MKLLTEIDVCKMIGISVPTLRRWRMQGRGPTFVKFGDTTSSAIRYPESELEKFIINSIKYKQEDAKEPTIEEKVEELEKESKAEGEFDYYE